MARMAAFAMVVVALLGCATPLSPASGPTSCQPLGYSPAPVPFSFPPGPVSSATAEQTAVALFRACELPNVTELTSNAVAATGTSGGPNAGRPVWRVQVDATVTPSDQSPGEGYRSHFLIEVNQATGVPTLIAYG
jgi:hypothetical protein